MKSTRALLLSLIATYVASASAADTFDIASFLDGAYGNLTAPYYGARPPRNELRLHRRGWSSCGLCGGADRLGALFQASTRLSDISDDEAAEIADAVRAHGVVVIPGQNLTRAEQVEFTSRLGEVIVLPSSFEGKDPEPSHPAIQRITNFWADGTWKGPDARLGAYWHQDGQFWARPGHNVLSVLHAQRTPPAGGETGFADLRAAFAGLSAPLVERASGASVGCSVRDIADFAGGTEEDLSGFPYARHPVLDLHSADGGPMLYVGSPHMTVGGLGDDSPDAGGGLLEALLDHATGPSFTYFHAWSAGDVVVWDNTQTLHRSMPYVNDGTAVRELYRTQARVMVDEGGGGGDEL